jgi:hypothetical protein
MCNGSIVAAGRFPNPQRPVAGIVSDQWASEDNRERASEAAQVMDLLGIRADMAVADIGAGAGYYVGHLSHRVGPEGRVSAQDVDGPVLAHGTPRALLSCELAAVGYREMAWHWIEGRPVYLAVFEPPAERPEPERIVPCSAR